jgi:hypothetical protein
MGQLDDGHLTRRTGPIGPIRLVSRGQAVEIMLECGIDLTHASCSIFRGGLSMKSLAWIALVVVVVAAAALYYFQRQDPALPPEETIAERQVIEPPAPPAILHPVPEPPPDEQEGPLPPLDESDALLRDRLITLLGEKPFRELFLPDNLVRRMVVTVDNLDQPELPRQYLPVRSPAGSFIATGSGPALTISPDNYRRYAPYVLVAETVNISLLVRTYRYFYPLFQQAYVNLGYPSGYFNDRLIAVLEHLLQTPEISEPQLLQPKIVYTFADPQLQSLSAGQKLLLRSGPDNAARVKNRLRALHQHLIALPNDGQGGSR